MRKTSYLLEPIEKSGKRITYYAIDLEETSLVSALEDMSSSFPSINFVGLLGTYEEGLDYLSSQPRKSKAPRCALWLGSSIGNMTRPQATTFFDYVSAKLMDVGDFFLVGIDGRNDPAVVARAYDDSDGLSREFILNGLDHVNEVFGSKLIDRTQFSYLTIYNEVLGRHEAYYESLCDQVISTESDSINIKKDELINIEYR